MSNENSAKKKNGEDKLTLGENKIREIFLAFKFKTDHFEGYNGVVS